MRVRLAEETNPASLNSNRATRDQTTKEATAMVVQIARAKTKVRDNHRVNVKAQGRTFLEVTADSIITTVVEVEPKAEIQADKSQTQMALKVKAVEPDVVNRRNNLSYRKISRSWCHNLYILFLRSRSKIASSRTLSLGLYLLHHYSS
jgi:hypothetical protein